MTLRIAITADPEIPVPPQQYGGIERIVDLLARGLSNRGHEVTLFAHADSTTPVQRVSWTGKTSGSVLSTVRNARTLAAAYAAGGFDVIHSFSRLAYLTPILPLRIAKVMSYQRKISPHTVRLAMGLAARGTLRLVACSQQMIPRDLPCNAWSVVYNAVSLDAYRFRSTVPPDAPLVFLGRLEEIKGPHLAIQIARQSGRSLVLAGNIPSGHQSFFEKEIRPHLDDKFVRYIGPVNDAQKNELLGCAAALLMPILWDEPFGIVMAEAFACGTPVVAFLRGAAPEVVDHGVTGFLGRNLPELIDGVDRIGIIDRRSCRAVAEARFGAETMISNYLECYDATMFSDRYRCAS